MVFLSPIDSFVINFVTSIINEMLKFSPTQWVIFLAGVVLCADALIRKREFGWFKLGFTLVCLAFALPTIIEIYKTILQYVHNPAFALFLTVVSIFIGINVVKWIAREMK